MANLIRVFLTLKDAKGREISCAFHTEDRGAELNPSLLKVGNTVVLPYAQRHTFASSPPGIRVEEINHAKVCTLMKVPDDKRRTK